MSVTGTQKHPGHGFAEERGGERKRHARKNELRRQFRRQTTKKEELFRLSIASSLAQTDGIKKTNYIILCGGASPNADRYAKASATPPLASTAQLLFDSRPLKIQLLIDLVLILII